MIDELEPVAAASAPLFPWLRETAPEARHAYREMLRAGDQYDRAHRVRGFVPSPFGVAGRTPPPAGRAWQTLLRSALVRHYGQAAAFGQEGHEPA